MDKLYFGSLNWFWRTVYHIQPHCEFKQLQMLTGHMVCSLSLVHTPLHAHARIHTHTHLPLSSRLLHVAPTLNIRVSSPPELPLPEGDPREAQLEVTQLSVSTVAMATVSLCPLIGLAVGVAHAQSDVPLEVQVLQVGVFSNQTPGAQ